MVDLMLTSEISVTLMRMSYRSSGSLTDFNNENT